MNAPVIPLVSDHLPIALRAFTGPQFLELKDDAAQPSKAKNKPPLSASPWTLTFDTETQADAGQGLRFGAYQLRNTSQMVEAGLFYDPDGVTTAELDLLTAYAEHHRLALRTREDFVDEIFFARAYQFRARIIGFNLPFDISRIAIRHGAARSATDAEAAPMRGGFTFTLSQQKIYPNIQVKHLSQRAAIIRFAATMGQNTGRSQRKRGSRVSTRRGHFIDVKTMAAALFARSFSLDALSRFLAVDNPKQDKPDFSAPISAEMIGYALGDVQATWECHEILMARFDRLGLSGTNPEKIYSEAGIGKGYLREMGIAPWRKLQPDFPRHLIAKIMGSYYGGRSEVRIRRETRQVMLCDFLSMYPTVCTLMGLWRFVIAQGMTWADSTAETCIFLDAISLADLQDQSLWSKFTTLVRVVPDGEVFPVRADYADTGETTIGANHLSSDHPLWFTLADCIAAKMLTGKAPVIVEAITFAPGPVQDGLCAINIGGNPDYHVDPATSDFFKTLIELRQSVKVRQKGASGSEWEAFDTEQNALKIAANSTSYGIWVEQNVETRPGRRAVTVHGSTGEPFSFKTDKSELPGSFFHPLLATLITGAARLMLAIAERLITDEGLDWCFCDTDSMAIAKPTDVGSEDFTRRATRVVDWFTPLNPYAFHAPILKIEDVNKRLGGDEIQPLYCWAISSKRYALFNLDEGGKPVLRKVSAHGLGHLRPPYDDDNPPPDMAAPDATVLGKGIRRWHCDLWHQIIMSALAVRPDQVALDYHPALANPAISRYAATSPDLLRWFKSYNADRSYRDQVKPFGFLLSMSARKDWSGETIGKVAMARRRKAPMPSKPIAPFDTDHDKAVKSAFDRDSGAPVLADSLKSYAQTLAQYHLQPEAKFLNARYTDRGTTVRRHVHVAYVRHIGKEAHDWERQAVLGLDADSAISYWKGEQVQTRIADSIRALMAEFGRAPTAKAFGLSSRQLESAISSRGKRHKNTMVHNLTVRIPKASKALRHSNTLKDAEINVLRHNVQEMGLRETARRMGIDPSNLRRRIMQR